MSKLGVGIIGCGSISTAYLRFAPMFRGIEIRAVADLKMEVAKARAAEFLVRAETVDGLLDADDIDIIVNLTAPIAHFEILSKILISGKHVYSEKPLGLTMEEGAEIFRLAKLRGLRVGAAPDTFLGASHQQARALIDDGMIGDITCGTAFVISHGMENRHPNPNFFHQPGAGPVLDLGPYYISNLVQLLGPVVRVGALSSTPSKTRTVLSELKREARPLNTPTTIHALLEFESGAIITWVASWDVWGQGHRPIELYGTKGSLELPDPNYFCGDLDLTRAQTGTQKLNPWAHPLGKINDGGRANCRTAGLAEMALAIQDGFPHRCSLDMALHTVEVLTGVLASGDSGQFVEMTTRCTRPAPLPPELAEKLLEQAPAKLH